MPITASARLLPWLRFLFSSCCFCPPRPSDSARARRRPFFIDMHSAGTQRGAPPAQPLSASTPATAQMPTALPAQVGITQPGPAHPLSAARSRGSASRRPHRARPSIPPVQRHQRRPPAPCALNCCDAAAHLPGSDRRASSPPLTSTVRRCSSPGSPLRLAASARRRVAAPCPPYHPC